MTLFVLGMFCGVLLTISIFIILLFVAISGTHLKDDFNSIKEDGTWV